MFKLKRTLSLYGLTHFMPGTLGNIEDRDEKVHRLAFYQGLHYLLR